MTYPRSHLESEDEPKRSLEHRPQWIEDWILELAECFAVSVYAYVVMSNHFLCGAPHNVCYVKSGVM